MEKLRKYSPTRPSYIQVSTQRRHPRVEGSVGVPKEAFESMHGAYCWDGFLSKTCPLCLFGAIFFPKHFVSCFESLENKRSLLYLHVTGCYTSISCLRPESNQETSQAVQRHIRSRSGRDQKGSCYAMRNGGKRSA
eukprot:6463263-Amphidinium_carterae.1